MQWSIEARKDFRAHQAGLALAPVRAGNDLSVRDEPQRQPVAIQQQLQRKPINGVDQEHRERARRRYLRLVKRRIAMETKSLAICWRRISASCSFASCKVSSKLKSFDRLMVCG